MSHIIPKEKFSEVFPHPTIEQIEGKPTFTTLNKVLVMLRANAISIDSDRGGGEHGHLGLLMTAADYATYSATAFVAPVYPEATATIPDDATSQEISRLRDEHKANLTEWRTHHYLNKVLKAQIMGAFETNYYHDLIDPLTGHINKTPWEIMQHLFTIFGTITQSDIEENNKQMLTSYDPTEPINNLFKQIENGVQFAKDAKQALPDSTVVGRAHHLIVQTGEYNDQARAWQNQNEDEKTWSNFKTTFTKAYQQHCEFKKSQTEPTLDDVGFTNQANLMEQQLNSNDYDPQAYFVEGAKILADHEAKESTSPTTATTNEANAVTPSLAEFEQLMKTTFSTLLKESNKTKQPRGPGRDNNNNSNNKNRNANGKNSMYCWTHGACNHLGTDCKSPATGHKKEATFDNRMEGSTKRCFWLPNQST